MIHFCILHVIFFLAVVLTQTVGLPAKRACAEKEESLALLELAKDSITKAKELVPECKHGIDNSTNHNTSECGLKEKTGAYIDVALKLIDEAKEHYPTCKPEEKPDEKPDEIPFPMDCQEIQKRGQNTSGVYTIWINHPEAANKSLEVFCDMDTNGGGWTVIQRRVSDEEDFYREWETYRKGFGNIKKNFWLGNENIFLLTNQANYSIRFDMRDASNISVYAAYEYFRIENEKNAYKLHITGYRGDAGDAMDYHNEMLFTTKDRRHDTRSKQISSCADQAKSGWWFKDCAQCNPNGLYRPSNSVSSVEHLYWVTWNRGFGLSFIEIKLRRTAV